MTQATVDVLLSATAEAEEVISRLVPQVEQQRAVSSKEFDAMPSDKVVELAAELIEHSVDGVRASDPARRDGQR